MDFREILLENCRRYPKLRGRDLIKLLYQYSFGCEHLAADEKTVNVYIHYLREKLESGGEKIIISSRNMGYKIDSKYLGEVKYAKNN